MNSLKGHIVEIQMSESLSIVSVKIDEATLLKAIVIETPQTAPYLKIGTPINVLFKETEVVLGANTDHAISLQNRILGTIELIEKGTLISKVLIQTSSGKITSIISTNAVMQLNLEQGMSVLAMVKLNEMMLSE